MRHIIKTIIVINILIFLFSSCNSSKNQSQSVPYNWNYIEYSLTSAPLAPPNYSHYSIFIDSKLKKGYIEYIINYKDSSEKKIKYDITIKTDTLEKLNKLIISSEILNIDIPSVPEHEIPDGSPLKNIKINFNQNNVNKVNRITPYFPTKEYREQLNSLYYFIESVVPEGIWEIIYKEKENYIKNYKN